MKILIQDAHLNRGNVVESFIDKPLSILNFFANNVIFYKGKCFKQRLPVIQRHSELNGCFKKLQNIPRKMFWESLLSEMLQAYL